MPRLIDCMDGRMGCWSKLQLDSGDPVYIAVAQTGIVIKRSRTGLMGAILFKESELYTLSKISTAFSSMEEHEFLPERIQHPVLRAFTNAALHADSAASVSRICGEARTEALQG